MKYINRSYLLFFLFAFAACATINQTSTVVGKWRLTETLADIGDGKEKWHRVESESNIIFNNDGTITSTGSADYQSYTILESNKIEFTLRDNRKQVVSFKIEGSTLILSPQCIEACGSKYVRVN